MVNRLYNKQVSPKKYMGGGRVKKMGGGKVRAKFATGKQAKNFSKLPEKVHMKIDPKLAKKV